MERRPTSEYMPAETGSSSFSASSTIGLTSWIV